jgi:nuclear pore complex protein Nup160
MYSWYIKRGDYRNGSYSEPSSPSGINGCSSAASTMYQRARILEQHFSDDIHLRFRLISLQVEAYIIAINALCLLDDRDAWISLPLPDDAQLPGENYGPDGFGRFGGALPESKFGEANRDSEIVELADMRRECELCSSRRRLVYFKLAFEGDIADAGRSSSEFEVDPRLSLSSFPI